MKEVTRQEIEAVLRCADPEWYARWLQGDREREEYFGRIFNAEGKP